MAKKKPEHIKDYVDIFKTITVTFITSLVIGVLILRIPENHQNIFYYIITIAIGYYSYYFWNKYDNQNLFSKLKIPYAVIKSIRFANSNIVNPIMGIIVILILVEQVDTNKSLVNPTEMPLSYLIAIGVLIIFKISFKLLEALLINHYIVTESDTKMKKSIKKMKSIKPNKIKSQKHKQNVVKRNVKTKSKRK